MVKIRRILRWGDLNMTDLALDKLIVHFAQSNKADGKSPKTVAWYIDMLTCFVKFLVNTGRKAVLPEFNIVTVREYIIFEQEREVSPFTVQCRVRSLKAFASWLSDEGYTQEQVLANLKMPKAPANLIEPLTSGEIDRLLKYQNPLTAFGCRNIAILVLLLDSGLRLSEMCELRTGDAHVEEGYLKVMGKGSKERVVPIGNLAQKVLWRYIIHFRPEPEMIHDKFVFLALDGKPLSTNAVRLLLKRWGRSAGGPRLHAHLCRHTYATSFLNNNCGDVFRLQQILGHTTLEMVRRYVHFTSTQDMINGKVSSPMDHMGVKRLNGYKLDRMLRENHALPRNRIRAK